MTNLPKIFLVDDDEDICLTLEIGLKANGFSIMTFTDPMRALFEFEPGIYDLVLLDVRMPKMGGFELFKKIREKDPMIRVCFLTAFEAFPEFKSTFPALAQKHFQQKPIGIKELVRRINDILK